MHFLINLLLWVTFAASLKTLLLGIVNKSPKLTLTSSILLLPLSYYIERTENFINLLAYLPVFPLLLTIYFIFKKKAARPFDGYS